MTPKSKSFKSDIATPLTPEQIRLFRHNGFLKLPHLLPQETVKNLKAAAWADLKNEVEPVVHSPDGQPVRLSQLMDRDNAIFRQVATSTTVLDPLESILGPNIEIVKNRHNHATLNLASKNTDRFHRDITQWSQPLTTVIFYLEETHLDNGWIQLIPGSHLLPGINYLHKIDLEPWVVESGIVHQAVPMPAGGLLLIDSLVFHRIGTNHTPNTRMSMTVGYRSVDELAGVEDPKCLLARGARTYIGNDQTKIPLE